MHCIAALDRIQNHIRVRCPLSVIRCPFSGQSVKNFKWPELSNATLDIAYFVFGSRLGLLPRIALFNLTAHELHELYYDRPTS